MGWWTQNEKGQSFQHAEGDAMFWGDGPADAMDNALEQINAEFERDKGRKPTRDELHAGLEFSLGAKWR
jgi:hypothetical protein